MYANLKRSMEAQNLEFKAREEAQLKGYNELKEVMYKQSDTMTNMMSQMMEMMKNQAKPYIALIITCAFHLFVLSLILAYDKLFYAYDYNYVCSDISI